MEAEGFDATNTISKNSVGIAVSTAEEMDRRRQNTAIVDYLCKLDEAREWVSQYVNVGEDLSKFLEELPKGVWLAQIAKRFDPRIKNGVHEAEVREYLHTENINMFLGWLKKIRLSRHFLFEVLDLYESKNIPKVIYCIHGLAHFLKRKGMCEGIERRITRRLFSEAERALVKDDIESIQTECYEDITNNLGSDDYEDSRSVNTEEHKNTVEEAKNLEEEHVVVKETKGLVMDEQHNASNKSISNKNASNEAESRIEESTIAIDSTFVAENANNPVVLDVILWKQNYTEINEPEKATIWSIRRFAYEIKGIIDGNSREIERIQEEIITKFKNNYELQLEKESLLRSARLYLENQALIRGARIEKEPAENDYRTFKKVLYMLINDFELLFKIFSSGDELPLRIFFPDTSIGDYHFSRFVEWVMEAYPKSSDSLKVLRKIVRSHFLSSQVFSSLTSLFDFPEAATSFDLNPVSVAESLGKNGGKGVLLDEAIKEKDVRDEIVRRSAELIDYLSSRLKSLLHTPLPFYVRLFTDTPQFFEDFIEPAILLSRNFIVAELVRYVYYNRDLFETQTMSFEQERLFYYNCKFDKTTDFDFTDYSPLRDFLESEENRRFRSDFAEHNKLNVSSGEYFLSAPVISSNLVLSISLEEINSIVKVLHLHSSDMGDSMASMVAILGPIRLKPESLTDSVVNHSAPVVLDGSPATSPETLPSKVVTFEASASKPKQAEQHPLEYFKQRFDLSLDTQFLESHCCDDILSYLCGSSPSRITQCISHPNPSSVHSCPALDSIVRTLRSRLLILIAVSESESVQKVLTTPPSASEYARYEVYCPMGEPLDTLRLKVVDDLSFLVQRGTISPADDYRELVTLLARDVLAYQRNPTSQDIALNSQTLDALYKKECMLSQDLKILYRYSGALAEKMVVNKSGIIFNRQAHPHSRYGTYMAPLTQFDPVLFENLKLEYSDLIIMMNDLMVVSLIIQEEGRNVSEIENVSFSELLRLREDGVTRFEFNKTCALSVVGLINMINDKYIVGWRG